MKRKLTLILLSALLAVALAACAAEQPAPAPGGEEEEPPETAAEAFLLDDDADIAVLGDGALPVINYAYFFVISRNNLEQSAAMSGYGPNDMSAFWNMLQGGVSIRDMLMEETMALAKEYTELYRLAASQGVEEPASSAQMADERVETLLADREGDEAAFAETYLLTPGQMREVMRRINIAAAYLSTAMEATQVSEQDMLAVYQADPDAFDQVTVRHILISVSDEMTPEERAAATALAEELLARINAGEEIGVLAGEYSEDPGSRGSQGEYTFGAGVMVPQFEGWAFAAEIGDTGIVLTDYGYHIMEMIGRTGFEEVSPAQLENQARVNAFYAAHSELYDRVHSDEWVYDQALLDRFAALLA